MALDPILFVVLIIFGSFMVTFIATYLVVSRIGKGKKEKSYGSIKPKKLSKRGYSLLEKDIVNELIKTIPEGTLDPDSMIELQEIFYNGLMNIRKEKSNPDKLIFALKELRNNVEQWVVLQGASHFEISKLVYDFFFEWYNSVEGELY